ncbi:MAG: cyclase/dehydrase [Solirubrobacterales bacterium]|jgi:ribosome-associated toxin RatA of RatAB toxin-antitoxin module|nr:cyclase/dehydrase [Solirubrobacterales bacterium]
MGVERGERSVRIAAPALACFEALLDFESYPEWQDSVKETRVLERDPDGRGSLVETVVDARVRTIRYVLRYAYEPFTLISWDYVEGDARSVEGDYRFAEHDGATDVTYRLAVDVGRLGRFVPGEVKRRAAEHLMSTAVEDLKARVEGRRA